MSFFDVLAGLLILSLLFVAFIPIIMSVGKLNPAINLTLANAVQSQLYGVNKDIQQLAMRKDCDVRNWNNKLDSDSIVIIVEAECKDQPLNVGRFIYTGH